MTTATIFRVLGDDGFSLDSSVPGTLGGNRRARIYGTLGCASANRALARGYAARRVFFADERTAIAAGYRPCGHCLRERYREWRRGPRAGTPYPWRIRPSCD